MSSFNKVILMGNLTRDPEMRVTPGGLSICNFSLAVNRTYKGQDGEQKDETSYVDVESFGRQAETISKYVTKGRPLLVEGRLKQQRWETQQGDKRSKIVVTLESFTFVGGRGDSGDSGGQSSPIERNSPPARSEQPKAPADDIEEDDVPF